ncbi:MAG: hypothetical protein U0V72_07810 [Cytophagales bacterium]
MKHLLNINLCIILLIFLSSCESKKSEVLNFQNTKKDILVKVNGEKPTSLDPWKVNIVITCHNQKDSLGLEIYADDLNHHNVHCTSVSTHEMILKFEQQDNSSRTFSVKANANGCSFKEIEHGY